MLQSAFEMTLVLRVRLSSRWAAVSEISQSGAFQSGQEVSIMQNKLLLLLLILPDYWTISLA